jgi:hypothetical protein
VILNVRIDGGVFNDGGSTSAVVPDDAEEINVVVKYNGLTGRISARATFMVRKCEPTQDGSKEKEGE